MRRAVESIETVKAQRASCPKCGFEHTAGGIACLRCGVVFQKLVEQQSPEIVARRGPLTSPSRDDHLEDGRVGRHELIVLGVSFAFAVFALLFPLTRLLLSALVTLFHELGHAVAGWLLGHPSIPAFDFVYGGGFTHQSDFKFLLGLLIAAAFVYGAWVFRQNPASVALIVGLFALWLVAVSGEWRRELVIASAGHLAEFVLAGVFFYQSLSGTGLRHPDLERPLAAFAAFFVQLHSMQFAFRLRNDPVVLRDYRAGKGGALMNDLEVVVLDLKIHLGIDMTIETAAGFLLVFSIIPIAVAFVAYLYRSRCDRVVRSFLGVTSDE